MCSSAGTWLPITEVYEIFKIPDSFDLSTLNGKTINQISFGLNVIVFYFDSGFIQFESGFSFEHEGVSISHESVFPVTNDFGLLSVLEKNILSSSTNDERDEIALEFENGAKLVLYSTPYYEAFLVKTDKGEFRV